MVRSQPSRGLPTDARANERKLERETGFEPATSTLARSHSTTELFPLFGENSAYHSDLCPIKNADVCSRHSRDRLLGGPKRRDCAPNIEDDGENSSTLHSCMMRPLPFCFLLLIAAVPAHADEVRLKNGDRITGVASSLAGGTLTFKAAGGELKMPWAEVTSLGNDQPVVGTPR